MARTTRRAERTETRTTNELFEDRFNGMWGGNIKNGSINLRALRNFAKMCKAIDEWDGKTAFTAKDLGVASATLDFAYRHKIVSFNKMLVKETSIEYQQVDNPDKRTVVTRKTKTASYHPAFGIDYKALAEATEEYVINQIKDI